MENIQLLLTKGIKNKANLQYHFMHSLSPSTACLGSNLAIHKSQSLSIPLTWWSHSLEYELYQSKAAKRCSLQYHLLKDSTMNQPKWPSKEGRSNK